MACSFLSAVSSEGGLVRAVMRPWIERFCVSHSRSIRFLEASSAFPKGILVKRVKAPKSFEERKKFCFVVCTGSVGRDP